MVQGVKMLSDVAGADNAVSRGLGKAADALTDLESPYRKAQKQERAAKIKTAEASGSTWEEIKAHAWAFADAPIDTTLNALGTAAPTLAAAAIPGLGQAALASRAAQIGVGVAQGVGNIKGSIHETTKQKYLEAGASEAEATQRADAAQAYGGDNLGSIALGGALGGVAGGTGAESAMRRLLGRGVASEAAERAAPGMVRSAVSGAAKEAPMEAVQGGQERLAGNLALQGEGFDVPTWQGVAGQAALEGLASVPVGGGFGVADGAQARSRQRADATAAPADDPAPLLLGNTPDPMVSFPDGTVGRRSEVEAYLTSLPPEQQTAARARLYGYAPEAAELTTSPGAADPGAARPQAAAPVEALQADTAPGAQPARDGLDFTRDFDTAGFTLEDPAEVERARAATIDYEPTPATPQWETAAGAAPERQPGLDMPAPEFDTGTLELDTRTPSQRLGIDPAAGPLSRVAAQAVDTQAAQAGPAEAARQSGAQAFAAGVPRAEVAAIPNVMQRAHQLRGYDEAASAAAAIANQQGPNGTTALTSQAPAATESVATTQPITAAAAPTNAAAASPAAPAATTEGDSLARQAQAIQAGPQQPQAGNQAPAGRAAAGEAQPVPAAAAPAGGGGVQAPGLSEASRPDNWRTSMLRAGPVAKALGIDTKGKRLAQVVAEIDAAEAPPPAPAAPAPRQRTAGDGLRSRSWQANPMRAFLAKHGVSLDSRSEFAPGLREMRGAMVPGYGPMFRKTGKSLDTLAQAAVEEGFLAEADEVQLYQLIDAAVRRGERVAPQYTGDYAEREMRAEMERRQQLEREAAEDEQAEADAELTEHEAVMAREIARNPLFAGDDADIPLDTPESNISTEQAMRLLGFTEEETREQTERDAARESAGRAPGAAADGAAARAAPAGDGRGQEAAREGQDADAFALNAPTRGEVLQRQQTQEQAQADEARQQKEAERRAEADGERDSFTLTGSDRAADVAAAQGQQPMFSRGAAAEPASLSDVRTRLDALGVEHTLSESRGVLTVNKVVVPEHRRNAGAGTAAMQAITGYADAAGVHVALTPSADFGGNKARLTQFYKRFGFKENKGRAKVYEVSETMVRENPQGRTLFSRSAGTRAAYEARIDALFAGEKPRAQGVRVLDRSDVLALLGLGEGPVHVVEGKVEQGQFNHGLSAQDWKKVPEWLESPAAVFDSDTSPGRLVFIAPELVRGSPVRMIIDPRPDGNGVNLLINAYDAERNPFQRWEREGLLRYFDKQKAPAVTGSFQPRLAGLPGDRGRGKILTEKHLAGYRRAYGPAFSFAGEQAATADQRSLATAKKRLAAGKSAESVRKATGWHQGTDGKWRFEISDADASLRADTTGIHTAGQMFGWAMKTKDSLPLSDVLWHPALFAAYPSLAQVQVKFAPLSGRIDGSFDPDTSTITVNANADPRAALSILLHELQHGIQEVEGFAVGGTPQDKVLMPHVRKFYADNIDQFEGESHELVAMAKERAYRNLAGEVEARNTQARRGMTDEQRRATPPSQTADVAEADVIVTFNGREMASAPAPANAGFTPEQAAAIVRAGSPATPEARAAERAVSDERLVATQMLVDGLVERWSRAPEIIVARDMQDEVIPQHVRDYDAKLKSQGAAGEAKGFILGGKVYLLSDTLRGPNDIATVLFHEVLGHWGLRRAFGEDLNPILRQVLAMRGSDVRAKARDYGLDWSKEADRLIAAEEVLAEMAQSHPHLGFVQRAVAAIRNWLRRHVPGFKALAMTNNDIIQAFILPARGAVTRRQETASQALERSLAAVRGEPQFGRSAMNSVEATIAPGYTPEQQRAAERVFGAVARQTWAERAQSLRANLGTKLRQGLVDQFAPIKEVSPKAYMLARMSKGSDGAVEAALLYGKPFLRDGVYDVDMKDGGFAQVLASLKGEHDRFFQWVAAQRAERLKAEGKENLLTDQDITDLKTLNAGSMADGTPRMPAYAAALRELNAFNEAALKVAMESGLIDRAAYDLMKDQPYVPFYRLMEEDGGVRGPRFSSGLVNQQAWKKLKGGTQQLNADLLQNTLMNWSHLYAAAARNRASLETMAAADKMGIAYQVPADTKGVVKVMRDGVAEHWAVEDPYLLDAISAMSYAPGGLVKAMAPFKRLLTFGVTVNPTFKIRNLIRDSLSAVSQSDLGYNPFANVASGWKATARDSQIYASMLASGGIIKFGTQEDTGRLRSQIEKLGGQMLDKQGFDKLKGQMKSLWEAYEEFGDRTENVNRAALYERLIAKGHSHAEASFMARDLMDFSMSGKWEAVRFLAQTVPFLNARLQGLYKLGRAAKEDPRRFAAMAGAVSLASLGLLAAYGDDEDWKKREDWDRDAYWWFKVGDTAFRIPKPFELGSIGTLAERTAELMLSDEMTGKRFGQRISDMVFNTFAMDPTPQFIKPFIDVYANKDSFSGRAIEGMADERLRPQDRYNERTSEVARLLGSWGLPDPVRLAKGEYSGLSPKQIDFLLRGYFGWLATVTTTATDTLVRPVLDRGERPALRLRDTFLAGNFVESLPSGSSRYVSAMYEQARDIEQAWASYQAAIKSGDMEKAREIQEEEGPKLRNRLAVANAKRQIAELGQQAKRIESDRLMSAESKRERLQAIEARRNEIAQRVAIRN